MVKEDKSNREPIAGDGTQVSMNCAICGATLYGRVWDYPTLESMWGQKDSPISNAKQIGIVCASCGYAYCDGKHKKELKALRIGWRGGPCPDCGKMIRGDNVRYIKRKLGELITEEGRCMTCGAEEPLQNVTVWSGEPVGGDQISPDITWMGFTVLIPGAKAVKIVKVE